MSKIVAFGNQKGGVGKSTVIAMAANALSQAPFNINLCVIDCDRQQSLVEARSFEEEEEEQLPYPIYGMSVDELQDKIYDLDQQYDLILIDTAGRLDHTVSVENQEITKALMYADYLFIPFRAGSFNLEASIEYLKVANKLKELRATAARPLNYFGFVNMYKDRSKTNAFLVSEIEHLRTQGVPFMLCRLRNYTLFEEIDTVSSYYDVNANNKARLNFTVWLNEFVKILKNG
ncbi:ParA family protein [Aureispira anguillae]|uniref:ParA family protein n=1 Tax=Aureispira anguillae TaxID=2864201 RepID=A0A915YM77_9BACT|nr:ParA family protein [Aureispira anguillae]BDS15619.1 ParA family protein [Aureispira anguillae]